MTTAQAYHRVCMGIFYCNHRNDNKHDNCNRNFLFEIYLRIFDHSLYFYLKYFLFCFLIVDCYCNLLICASKLLLLCCGDVETNPGPTFFIKSVIGSFNQGDPRFGETAGVQCMCNSLSAICWSTIKKISIWKGFDLDSILEYGNTNFKKLGLNRPIEFQELPSVLEIAGFNVDITYLARFSVLLSDDDYFEAHKIMPPCTIGNGLIFNTCGYSSAIIWDKANAAKTVFQFF